ncbi:Retinol-binding protein pinta, partial [Gryllus bimaculatus]
RELALFLHSCYFSVEAAKATLDTYFTVRTHLPEFFAQRDPTLPEVQTAAEVTGIVTLEKPTQEGYKVIMIRPVDTEPSKFSHVDLKKVFGMVIDLWLYSEGTAEGHVIIFDMQGVTFGHFTKLSLIVFKKFFFYLQEGLPVRLKGLHFFNVVPFMDKMMAMMKPFMKKELFEVMHVHTEGVEDLFKFVPQEILPMDYGGAAPPLLKLH